MRSYRAISEFMTSPKGERIDPSDELPALKARRWAVDEKHSRLRKYVAITSAVRRKFLPPKPGGAAYIDPYCATARIWLEEDGSFHPGSAEIAWDECVKNQTPFTNVCLADLDEKYASAAKQRLTNAGAPVVGLFGAAEDTVKNLIQGLNPKGLHLAFLDPFSLDALPFSIIETLGKNLERVDLLIHFSKFDFQRNLLHNLNGSHTSLDRFAPGWKTAVGTAGSNQQVVRTKIVQHWCDLIRALGFSVYDHSFELVTGKQNQHLYWLVFASRNPKGQEFWDKIRNLSGQADLVF